MIRTSTFRAAWWLPGGHTQTLWPALMRRRQSLQIERERVLLPDGDFLDLAWAGNNDGAIVILLHGLEGSLQSHYALGMLGALQRQGFRPVFMHFRGCSGTPNRLARGYHSGETGDLRHVIGVMRARYPGRKFAAAGFSLGGNVLLKYLGEEQSSCALNAAACVSVPFELSRAADRLNQGFSKIYQRHLLRRMRSRLTDKFRNRNDAPFALTDMAHWNNFHLFDNFVTAPLHGFSSSVDYYRRCSSRQFIRNIMVPTLIIHAVDDPFLPADAIPDESEVPGNVFLELSQTGGHAGFVGGTTPWRPGYWLEQRIPEFLHDHLN